MSPYKQIALINSVHKCTHTYGHVNTHHTLILSPCHKGHRTGPELLPTGCCYQSQRLSQRGELARATPDSPGVYMWQLDAMAMEMAVEMHQGDWPLVVVIVVQW